MSDSSADEGEIVTVYSASNMVDMITAKLVLDGEGIPYLTAGEGVHHLFGLGAIVGGYNMITGPVRLQVRREDVERAREALESLEAGSDEQSGSAPPG